MAFGIDDALTTAAAAISLTDTIVETVRSYKKQKQDIDLERLLEEVRLTAIEKIDEVDLALTRFERMLFEREVDIDQTIVEIIATTPFWNPIEQYRLSAIRKTFNAFADSIYSAGDDIAALVRCREQTLEMGRAVVESAKRKHDLHRRITKARSLGEAIGILRQALMDYKEALSQ